jgi:hypothetical protein
MGNRNLENTFLEYAVLFWSVHAAFARTEFSVIREHESFFQLESSEREKWLTMYKYFHIPEGFQYFMSQKNGVIADFGLTNLTKITEPNNSYASSKAFDNADFKA